MAADAALVEPEPTPVLGIDGTRRGKPRWEGEAVTEMWRRIDRRDTGFTDLAGDQGLLGHAEGRRKAAVIDWLGARTPEFQAAIRHMVIDPAAVYPSAITTELLATRSWWSTTSPREARQRRPHRHTPAPDLGAARASGPQDRRGVGQPAGLLTGRGRLS